MNFANGSIPRGTPNTSMPSISENDEHFMVSESSNASTVMSIHPIHDNLEELTVNRKWKVEEELSSRLSKLRGPSLLVPLFKWLATILFGVGILTLFIATRLSFFIMSRSLVADQPLKAPNPENVKQWAKYSGRFFVLYISLNVPYILLLLRAAWMGLFTRQAPWPKKSAVTCAVIAGVLEPLGLLVLALKIIPLYSPSVGILVTGTVGVLPVFMATIQAFKGDETIWRRLICVLAFLFSAGGTATTVYLAEQEQISTGRWQARAYMMVAFLSLNIAWMPQLTARLIRSTHIIRPTPGSPRNLSSSLSTVTATNSAVASQPSSAISSEAGSFLGPSGSNITSRGGVEPIHEQLLNLSQHPKMYKKATWKASFITYLVRIIATFIIAFILFYIDTGFNVMSSFTDESHLAFLKGWNLGHSVQDDRVWNAFTINLIGAFVCYIMVFIVLHTNMHIGGMGVPLVLSLPLCVLMVYLEDWCHVFVMYDDICDSHKGESYYIIPAALMLTFGQIIAFGRNVLKSQVYLQKEGELFWIPGYQGAILDSWLLFDRRYCVNPTRSFRDDRSPPKTRVYICTTMYREDESEMRQLLESLARINVAQAEGERFFESHIVFDGGVVQKNLSEFALLLISLLDETLGVKATTCTKITTPYGLKLSWCLPIPRGKHQMTFNIHLKDNSLVKNKKRWSQVMYMSYVLDFLNDAAGPDEECYILTTDADVMFTPQSVEALLDLMTRDNTIGAVCARTHPMGSGPLVWYQIFEYAVGHWFQKASEHVLGSVLCAPGCFSVYRCRSLRDILPKYSKKVESAFDFLTKDMGEDRWLCTLLVQSGWRIEYCAASENSTNCPSEFEEFYKQRRRWIASTLANLMLIIQEWKYVALFNHRVSVIFLFYQALLLFSTLIGPSTVILVVAGGLTFAWGFNAVAAVFLQLVACVIYAIACICTSSKTHLLLAKIYTFLYATIMCAVVVGTAEQIVGDLNPSSRSHSTHNGTTTVAPSSHISIDIPVSVTTIYFAFLASVFLMAGLLHPKELYCLIHSLWYLLCLPSAYLVLTIYSICNLTDSSWGTREGTSNIAVVKKEPWHQIFRRAFYSFFFCCTPPERTFRTRGVDTEAQTVMSYLRHGLYDEHLLSASRVASATSMLDDGEARQRTMSGGSYAELMTSGEHALGRADSCTDWDEIDNDDVPIPVEDWLPTEFRSKYAETFKRHGFDSTLFIKGMMEKDLHRMGINTRGHVQFLIGQMSKLPAFEVEYKVPTNVNEWLLEIGLPMYKDSFRRNHIRCAREMEILKRFDRKDIEKELGITKEGHIKRLMYAIRMLRDPTEGQQKAMRMRQAIEETPVHYLREFNVAEYEFWNRLKAKCLEPDLKAFGIEAEVKMKLVELRNKWLLVLAISNILWLIMITTLASKGELTLLGANPLGLFFLFIFGFIFSIQFLCMLVHRLSTVSHYLARAPYKFGKPLFTNWSFNDKTDRQIEDTEDFHALRQVKYDAERALKRINKSNRKKSSNNTVTERCSLVVADQMGASSSQW